MCFDPWEESLWRFAELYHGALNAAENPNRTPAYRHQWAGKAEMFEASFADKLTEADIEEIESLAEDWDFEDEAGEKIRDAVDAERKRRAEEGAMV